MAVGRRTHFRLSYCRGWADQTHSDGSYPTAGIAPTIGPRPDRHRDATSAPSHIKLYVAVEIFTVDAERHDQRLLHVLESSGARSAYCDGVGKLSFNLAMNAGSTGVIGRRESQMVWMT